MRRLIAAAVLLLLLAGIIIGGRVLTEKSTKAFGEKISLCEAEYKNGNKKTAALKAAEIKVDWDKAHHYLVAVITRDAVDEITLSISKIESYAAWEEDSLFFCECQALKTILHHILEDEHLSISTIF